MNNANPGLVRKIMVVDPALPAAYIKELFAYLQGIRIEAVHFPDALNIDGRVRLLQPDLVLIHPMFARSVATFLIRKEGPIHVQTIALLEDGPPPPDVSGQVDGFIGRHVGPAAVAGYLVLALRRRMSLSRMRAAAQAQKGQ